MQIENYVPGMLLPQGDMVALDCETDSINEREANLQCIVIADGERAVIVSKEHVNAVYPLLKAYKRLLLQNFKYDYHVMYRHGFDLNDMPFYDTMLMHHLIDENKDHSLDAMVKEKFNDNYKEVFWAKYTNFSEASEPDALEYVGKDGIYTFRLATSFLSLLSSRTDILDLTHNLAKHLYLTELKGVRVDTELMQITKASMGKQIEEAFPKLRAEFLEYCELWEYQKLLTKLTALKKQEAKQRALDNRQRFNFGSDSQVGWLLYEGLKLPVTTKTKTGNPSCDYETIEKLAKDCPSLKPLLDYKSIKTIYATFVEGLIEKTEENRIYPKFSITGTVTGRISSSSPNMQNMPRDGVIRNFFCPDEGCVLIGADYAQLEVVIAANLSGDRMLTKSIMEGISLHDITAEGVGIPRDLAKLLNFAVQYGAQEYRVVKILKCSVPEAKGILQKYWETYSGLKTLVDACHAKVDGGEPIINPFGRHRHFPTEFERPWHEAEVKRQAFNSLVQGTGADITHKAFSSICQMLTTHRAGRGLWPVHDELVIESKIDMAEYTREWLIVAMESVGTDLKFKIPLTAKAYGPLERWSKA